MHLIVFVSGLISFWLQHSAVLTCFPFSRRELKANQEFHPARGQAVGPVAGLQGALPDREQLRGHFKHRTTGSAACLHHGTPLTR